MKLKCYDTKLKKDLQIRQINFNDKGKIVYVYAEDTTGYEPQGTLYTDYEILPTNPSVKNLEIKPIKNKDKQI